MSGSYLACIFADAWGSWTVAREACRGCLRGAWHGDQEAELRNVKELCRNFNYINPVQYDVRILFKAARVPIATSRARVSAAAPITGQDQLCACPAALA